MKMNHPENFEIEIDRSELRRFFADSYRRAYWTIGGVIALLGGLFSMAIIAELLEGVTFFLPAWLVVVISLVSVFAVCVLLVWLFAEFAFLVYGKRAGEKRVSTYRIRVEGAFLRITDGKRDRKTHFRQIGDYEAMQGNKRKPEVGTIRMFGPVSGANTIGLTIWAVKDVLAMRDLLAEVDAERE